MATQVEYQIETIKALLRYGGYNLKRDDRDDIFRYCVYERSAEAGDTVPPEGTTPYVKQLQQDLKKLGFSIVGSDDGIFGRFTEWAVREFQIYAKMPFVTKEDKSAERYIDRLSQGENTFPYSGPISGVVNADTRAALKHWLVNNWRCPVIINAYNMRGGNPDTVHTENIWLHNEVTSSAPRMYVRDFSNYYSFPTSHNSNDLVVLGDYVSYKSWEGPRSKPPQHTWAESEMLPEQLVGQNLSDLSAMQRSTYKVVRAVSEVECLGFFDSVNAYDNAFLSLGPCHWTLGIISDNTVSEGELCGYLAYLRHADPDAFYRAIEFFGVRVDEDWMHAGVANGHNLFKSSSRKYAGWVSLQQEDGNYARMIEMEDDGNYFKTWHWFYRFVMAGRTVNGFRRRMWNMARIRLRDIRASLWGIGVPDVPDGSGGTRPATIGDVYTSERAIALILRWHIRAPSHVVSGGHAGTRLKNALTRAKESATSLDWTGDPTTWIDAHEVALIQGILDEVGVDPKGHHRYNMDYVHDWPSWAMSGAKNPRGYRLDSAIGNLTVTRNSFQFDDSDLPPAPFERKKYYDDEGIDLQKGSYDNTGASKYGKEQNVPDNYVYDLQTDLNSIGYDCGKPDGAFGKNTKEAVKSFQEDAKGKKRRKDSDIIEVESMYTGEVTGVLDCLTAKEIKNWIDNDWKRPIEYGEWVLPTKDGIGCGAAVNFPHYIDYTAREKKNPDHMGWDISCPMNTDLIAIHDGDVIRAHEEPDLGNIVLKHTLPDGTTVFSNYGHINSKSVNERDKVKTGDVIGKSGKYHNSVHLHFEIFSDKEFKDPSLDMSLEDFAKKYNKEHPKANVPEVINKAYQYGFGDHGVKAIGKVNRAYGVDHWQSRGCRGKHWFYNPEKFIEFMAKGATEATTEEPPMESKDTGHADD